MEGEELLEPCFQIISLTGSAKSCYVEAVQKAKEGDFDGAAGLVKEGESLYVEGHDVHMGLLQKEAAGEQKTAFSLILLHAEDQMSSAEVVHLMALELIEIHQRLARH